MYGLQMIQHTPIWVFGVLVLLVWVGVQSMRDRQVRLVRLIITPVFFIAWGLVRLRNSADVPPTVLVNWVGGIAVGAAVGMLTARIGALQVDRATNRVHVQGDWFPLVRILAIFAAKYGIAAAVATHPELRPDLLPWDFAISGASAGYFLGWTIRFVMAYRSAPATPVNPAAAA